MARKRKEPRVIEDTTDTLFKFPCSNVECGYQIEKPGRWFDKQDHFYAPIAATTRRLITKLSSG